MSSANAKEGGAVTKYDSVFDAVVVGAGNGGLTRYWRGITAAGS